MNSRRTIATGIAVLSLGPLGLAVAGCGSSSSPNVAPSTDPTTSGSALATSTPSASGATLITATLSKAGEFTIAPNPTSVAAGKVEFSVTNNGTMTHEMVVVPAPAGGPAALAKADGSANEAGALGEAKDVPSGQTKSVALELKPGKYVLLCNLPGHFAGGMRSEITVT